MARRPEQDSPGRDPRVTDLRRYRRERERAERESRKRAKAAGRPGGAEPLLGRRRNAGLILVVAIVIVAAMAAMSGHRF